MRPVFSIADPCPTEQNWKQLRAMRKCRLLGPSSTLNHSVWGSWGTLMLLYYRQGPWLLREAEPLDKSHIDCRCSSVGRELAKHA